jgi:hypothetical protein
MPQEPNEELDNNPQQYVCIIHPSWDWMGDPDEAEVGNQPRLLSDDERLKEEYDQYIDKMKPLLLKPAANHPDHKWVLMVRHSCYDLDFEMLTVLFPHLSGAVGICRATINSRRAIATRMPLACISITTSILTA